MYFKDQLNDKYKGNQQMYYELQGKLVYTFYNQS